VKLYDLIRYFEGLRLKVYPDPGTGAEPWTVGYGHTGPDVKKDSPPITPAIAETLMREDAERACLQALRLSPNLAGQDDRLSAIADFIFNAGSTRYKASTLRRKIRDGDWLDAKDEILKWCHAGGRKLPGLVLRRKAEAALL
jgi:lysozyme